jgi:hypothetical protein
MECTTISIFFGKILPKYEKLKIKKKTMSQIPSNFGKKIAQKNNFELVLSNL